MKELLLEIINNDLSSNKSSTRYLYKSHPDLWQQILNATNFLPTTAKPKQRIWHVVNEIYVRPVCPIAGTELPWWENRYLTTSSLSAKMKLQHLRGDFKDGHSPECNEKRKQSNLRAVVRGRKYRSKDTYTTEQTLKSKQTSVEKYGVDNFAKTKEHRQKISDIRIANGATPRHLRSYKRLYYDAVWKFTEQSWQTHFDEINPTRLRRSLNALDHIYSIQQGFRDSIPPYIIGHWTNLRVIPMVENSLKGMRCDKTSTELFDDFFACV